MRRRRWTFLLAGCVVAVTACATGPRPHLGDVAGAAATTTTTSPLGGEIGTPVGNAPIDAVLTLLEHADDTTFTATYHLSRKFDPGQTDVSVVHQPGRTSVTIDDTRYLDVDGHEQTCTISTNQCDEGLLIQRTSDRVRSITFYGSSTARQLRVTSARLAGDATASTTTMAGTPATCVDTPTGPGVEHYCATNSGPLARLDDAAVTIELQNFSPTVDPATFAG